MQGSKLLHRILKFINYVNLCKFIQIHKKCFFISWPISIIIVLFGRASLATQNLYTEFWNFTPLIIIYVNLFIIHKKCFFSLISRPILILIVLSHRARCRVEKLYTEFWNSLIKLIYANLFKCIHICSLSVKLYMYVSRSVGGWGQRHLGLKMLIVQNPFLGVKFSTFYWPRNRARLVVREPPCFFYDPFSSPVEPTFGLFRPGLAPSCFPCAFFKAFFGFVARFLITTENFRIFEIFLLWAANRVKIPLLPVGLYMERQRGQNYFCLPVF